MTQQHIAEDEPVFQISVVSRMVGIHQQTIRAYERVGLLRPARSSGNTRLFSHADVERLRQVVRLVTDLGINLAGVEVILRLSRQIESLQRELAGTKRALEEAQAVLEGSGHGGERGTTARSDRSDGARGAQGASGAPGGVSETHPTELSERGDGE